MDSTLSFPPWGNNATSQPDLEVAEVDLEALGSLGPVTNDVFAPPAEDEAQADSRSDAAKTVVARRPCVSAETTEALSSRDLSPLTPSPAVSRTGAPGDRDDAVPFPLLLRSDPLVGRVVADRYRILAPIGRGGMGIVYKVQHTRIGKLLAMKLLAGELSSSPEVVRRFKREALTVSRLESPNTVQVFDFGASDGLTYLVMELVSGENFGAALRSRGPLPFEELGPIVYQIGTSLAEAHQKGIVHRDIKPENVMILATQGGASIAKVLDFGLAKLREAEGLNEITSQGTILGTPYYMAPEQIRGDAVDARTDIYALGALTYRALTGHAPFSGTPVAVLGRHLHEAPIPPAERAPELGIPAGVSRLVMRALRKDPGDRFQSIAEMQALLVDELRAAGSRSVEALLDSARLRKLAATAARTLESDLRPTLALATRDEVDAYERELYRRRSGLAIGLAGMCAVGLSAALLLPHEATFSGLEVEPNNTAAEATPIPLGRPVAGRLGQRIDSAHGDRDFYAIDLPAGVMGAPAFLKLRVSALPNIAMCTLVYRAGFPESIGRYCVGKPGKDLVVPALALEPGRYFIGVLQDMSPHDGAVPFIHENISDTYSLLAESTLPERGAEVEPNDDPSSATEVALGAPFSATLGWAGDEDVFCVSGWVHEPIRWKVQAGFRDRGVLEATALRDGVEEVPVRVYSEGATGKPKVDAVSPWRSDVEPADGDVRRCLRIRLAADPLAGGEPPNAAGGSYVIEAERAP